MATCDDPACEADQRFDFVRPEPWKTPGWDEQCIALAEWFHPEPPPRGTPEHKFTVALENAYSPVSICPDGDISDLLASAPPGFWANPLNWMDAVVEFVHAGESGAISALVKTASETVDPAEILHGLGAAVFIPVKYLNASHDQVDPSARLAALGVAQALYSRQQEIFAEG